MIKSYQQWIEQEIKKQKFGKQPESLYEPIRYLMSLGGKRLRPMLTLVEGTPGKWGIMGR
jgi:geranylgeranyl diphosphate synthase type II